VDHEISSEISGLGVVWRLRGHEVRLPRRQARLGRLCPARADKASVMRKAASSWRPSDAADTPFHRVRQEWDRRMGATVVEAANWRVVAVGGLGLPRHRVDHHTVVIKGPMREIARNIGGGDTVRVDRPIGLHEYLAGARVGLHLRAPASSRALPAAGAPAPSHRRILHHAIVPTSAGAPSAQLSPAEGKVYELIARRYLRRRQGPHGTFWSCSRYPQCKQTATDDKPVPGRKGRRASSRRLRAARRRQPESSS
jgi:hypothetical protein